MDDPGGGPYNPDTGLRDWYLPPAEDDEDADPITWPQILDNWVSLEADLHDTFGVDVESGILAERTWRWFNVRMSAIINDPSTRLHAAIMADREPSAH